MAIRLDGSVQGINAAVAAVLVLAAVVTAPVLAAPDPDLFCEDTTTPTLDVSASELTATPVNNSDRILGDHLLEPRAKAAARSVFMEDPVVEETDKQELEAEEDAAVTDSSVPDTADSKPVTYKRRMYRRDI